DVAARIAIGSHRDEGSDDGTRRIGCPILFGHATHRRGAEFTYPHPDGQAGLIAAGSSGRDRLSPAPRATYAGTSPVRRRRSVQGISTGRGSKRVGKDLDPMGVSSGRLRVADLSFQVFRRPMHPDWFTTRAFRRVEHRGWGADLRIIEGGH